MITIKGTTVTISSGIPKGIEPKTYGSLHSQALDEIQHVVDAYNERRNRIQKAWKERKKANKAKQKDIWLKFDEREG